MKFEKGGGSMLLYPGTGVEVLDKFQVEEKKVVVVTLKARDFNGEHDKRSHFYIIVLWLVSVWAMITNSAQAFFIKLFKKKKSSFVKILWQMGRDPDHISSTFVDRFSRFNHQSKIGAAGWRSLDICYNYHEKIKPQLNGNFEGFITRYWIEKMQNRQAVTNRYKIVVDLLVNAFRKFISEREIRLVSIASGSAQAVIEAMRRCPQLLVKTILIDVDKTAIEKARQEVKKAGLEDRFVFIRGTTRILEEVCQEFRPHIIEMVGFLDYLPKKKAIQLINCIRRCLSPGGFFLTSNIRKNSEKIFLSWVLLWPMIYRSETQFVELLVKGGFSSEKINVLYEPFRIHGIGICQK
jgi:hypothetical protein